MARLIWASIKIEKKIIAPRRSWIWVDLKVYYFPKLFPSLTQKQVTIGRIKISNPVSMIFIMMVQGVVEVK